MIHIVGAGPVGMLLACLLGKQGREVTLYEKRLGLPEASMAIGITPPSLDILDTLDLKTAFLQRGVLIPRARVYESGKLCGPLDFRASENEILSLPQFGTLELLRQCLSEMNTVRLLEGVEITPEHLQTLEGQIIACDGARSQVRKHLNIPVRQKTYPVTFVMADFPDDEKLGPEALLYFSPHGAVESFPLPKLKRRWIAQCTGGAEANLHTLRERVLDAAGIDLSDREHGNLYDFTPRRVLAKHYARNHVILCGDAAHIMSPIGGQGMNTGFADAWHLSRILPNPGPKALASYTRTRQRAFRIASRRAATGMWLGTRTGKTWSQARSSLLRIALHQPHIQETLARTFAMRNFPIDFSIRATDTELMDLPDCDPDQLIRTLDQFHHINRLFSRVRGLLRQTLLADMQPGRPYHLVDLGAGACDIPVWLLGAAKRKGLDLRITAVDTDPRTVRYARERYGPLEGLEIREGNALELEALAPFDYLFANHFLHHLPDEVIPGLLNEAHRLCQRGFVISDLRRSPWSYHAFSLFARIYRNSFSRTDGLISIRKGFQPRDFQSFSIPLTLRTQLPGRIQILGGCFHKILNTKKISLHPEAAERV